MNPAKVRLGVIGLGYWGPHIVRNASSSPALTLVGLCDSSPDRLNSIATRHPGVPIHDTVETLLVDPAVEAVVIATPVATHAAIAEAAIAAGKHVLVEKPMDSNSQSIERLDALASAKGLTLMVDHVYLFHPAVEQLVSLFRRGDIGDLLFIDSIRINLGIFQNDVNVLWDLATHDVAIINYLVGHSPKSVSAIGSTTSLSKQISMAHLHLDYGEGLLASVHVNWLSPVKLRHFLVAGTRRSGIFNELDQSEPLKIYDRGVELTNDPEGRRAALFSYRSGDVISPAVPKVEALQNSLNHFAQCVRSHSEPLASASSAAQVAATIEAANLSIEQGGTSIPISGATA